MANIDLTTKHNATLQQGNMPAFNYWNRPSNKAFTNYYFETTS